MGLSFTSIHYIKSDPNIAVAATVIFLQSRLPKLRLVVVVDPCRDNASDRRISAGLSGDAGTWHYSASIIGDEEGSDDSSSESLGFRGRLAWGPKFGDSQLHVGASASWQDPGADEWRVQARPETQQGQQCLGGGGPIQQHGPGGQQHPGR